MGFIIRNAFSLDIESTVIKHKGYIPDRYTCEAQNFSPSLSWKDAPANTKTFVLIIDDQDADFKPWVHWILFNIPCDVREIKENISAEDLAESGIIQGKNDFGEIGYGGPCPPKGKPHRYFLKLYALDESLSLKEGATKKEVLDSISGHILAETKLISSYQCLKED